LSLEPRAHESIVGRVSHRDDQDRLIKDLRARQQNTLWPEAMVNSSSVDALLWKGSPNATRVQRIGIAIWGLAFACIGAACEMGAWEKHEPFLMFFGLPWLALGAKLTFNAFKRSHKPTKAKKR
jgi:hypothetical protein